MKHLIFVFVAFFSCYINVLAQCPQGNITLSTQQEVDNFAVQYPNCTMITGNLTIGNYYGDTDISDLTPLNQITDITGSLYLRNNPNLLTMNGLNNITTIRTLFIYNNDNLVDLSGLENLSSIGLDLEVRRNDNLITLTGLENVGSVGRNFKIEQNNNLTNLTGLGNISSVGGSFWLSSNANLTTLTGLESLSTVGSYMNIGHNAQLSILTGLENLSSIAYSFTISVNNNLTTLEGLDNLNSVGTYFIIIANDNLTTLTGLENLNSVGSYFEIIENNSLTALTGLENLSLVGEYMKVSENGLTTVAGLQNSISVGEELEISKNLNLTTLEGFEHFTSFNGNLRVSENVNLTALEGLENLNSVNGDLTITGHPILTTLTGLENLNSVSGTLTIGDNDSLTDLVQLENLTSVTGLSIGSNDNLTSLNGLGNITSANIGLSFNDNLTTLTGLENLKSVANFTIGQTSLISLEGLESIDSIGYLSIWNNESLATLTGLEGMTIFNRLYMSYNPALTDLTGLSGISSIDEARISRNSGLTSLAGMDNLKTVTDELWIEYNHSLLDMNGLEGLESITGLKISYNNSLASLTGLNDEVTLNGISITDNDLLYLCNVPAICNYLEANPNAGGIYDNSIDCGSVSVVRDACTSNDPCPENVYLNTQQEINNFLINYPNCMEISGNLTIGSFSYNTSIVDLSPLSNLSSVGGYLYIRKNYELTSLEGLNNLNSVGGYALVESNNSLTNFEGLNNLNSIGDYFKVQYNNNLIDFTGLENLTSIGKYLNVFYNGALQTFNGLENLTEIDGNLNIYDNGLTELSGLDNIDPATIKYLKIRTNPNLSICDVSSICTYLDQYGDPNDEIYGNASGCNSQTEVEVTCTSTPPDNPCGDSTPTTDSLTHIFDEDLFIDGVGFANNPNITFTDPATPADAVLSDISLELYFRLNGNSCENEIAIQITDPAGNTQPLTAYTTCAGGNGLYYVNLNIPSANTTGSIADWLVEFDDTNDQNSGYEYSVRFARLNYIATTSGSGGTPIVNQVIELADSDLFIDGVGFANNGNYTFTDPGTPADAVLSNISLELYFRLNGNSCENEIAIQITDPAGNTQALTAYTTCAGGNALYYVNLDVPSGNTTGSTADWLVEFDDTNDQNSDYEYSVRFGRLTYTTTHTTSGGGMPVTVNETVSEYADSDLFIDGVGFANNANYTFTDPGTPADAVLSNISLELYFRLNGNTCENEIAIQITDPAGNTQALTAYTTCDGGNALYYVNLDVPSGTTTGSTADWLVEFDDTNDQNSDYEYSVRFGRLTYDTEYTECMPMKNETNDESEQHSTTSAYKNTTIQQDLPDLSIFPNPTTGRFQVKGISQGTYIIHDATGRTIQHGELKNNLAIDISQEVQGMYFISIQMDNEFITKRIIKL